MASTGREHAGGLTMRTARLLTTASVLGAVLILAAGCSTGTSPGQKDAKAKAASTDDDHSHGTGPHGGTVADWKEEGKDEEGNYHVEFTVDHKKQEATVYVLKGDAKTPAPIEADKLVLQIKEPPFEVELKPVPEEKGPAGKAARFAGKHEKLGKEQEFEGTITGKVGGKTYRGEFKEEPEKK
jgi:hypothetical protein